MLGSVIFVTMMMADVTVTAPAVAPVPPAPQDKVVCRSYVETGSLVRRKKVCQTVRQWKGSDAALRDEGQRMQDQSLITSVQQDN